MKNIFILAKNTLKITFRKKSNILVYLIAPVIVLIAILGGMSGSGGNKIKVGIVDKEKSTFSVDMLNYLESTDKFEGIPMDEENASEKVVNKEVSLVIVIPKNFSESIYTDTLDSIRIVSIQGKEVTAWVENYTNLYLQNLSHIAKASEGDRNKFNKMYNGYKNQSLKLKSEKLEDKSLNKKLTQSGVGFLIMFILIGATSTTNIILKEKRERTYERICSTPVNSRTYVMGNIFVNLTIIIIQILLAIIVMKFILKINAYIPLYQLFLVLLLIGVVSIGIGMVIVAFSKSTSEAGNLSTLIITPSCMLGGCFWPIELMPEKLQKISSFMPQKWAIEAIAKLQSGVGMKGIYMHIAILIGFAAVLFLGAVFKMKNTDKTGSFI